MRLFLLTAVAMIAFAANSVLNRAGVGAGLIDPAGFAVLRLLAGAAMLGLLLIVRRGASGRPVWPGGKGRAAGAGSLLLYLFGFSAAYRTLDAGVGALVLFGMVQITMFLGALATREPVPARRWIGATLAFLGLVFLLAPGADAALNARDAALMAVAGLGWGLYSLAARGTRDPLGATAWNFILAVPAALALVTLMPGGHGLGPVTPAGMALAILSGGVTSGLGYALWYQVLPGLGASRGGVAQLTVPLIALAGGMVFLGETVTLRFVLASGLVLGGVALALLPLRVGRQS